MGDYFYCGRYLLVSGGCSSGMGCDIHGTIESRESVHGGGHDLWFANAKLDRLLNRSYDHFAHLFGVRHYEGEHDIQRSDGKELKPNGLYADRGLPSDIANATRREYEEWHEDDSHSESYAYHHEIESALWRTNLMDEPGWKAALNISSILQDAYGSNNHVDGTIRWVVWFDN